MSFLSTGQVATIGGVFGGLGNIIWGTTSSTTSGTVTTYGTGAGGGNIYNNAILQMATSNQLQQGRYASQLQGTQAPTQNPYAAVSAGISPPAGAGAPLGFNRFVNASDLLEEFVRFAKDLGLKRRQFLDLPVELFIQWLVVRAAEVDGEPRPHDVPDPKAAILALPKPRSPWGSRCLDCKRFIPEKQAMIGIVFCSGAHMDRYRQKALA